MVPELYGALQELRIQRPVLGRANTASIRRSLHATKAVTGQPAETEHLTAQPPAAEWWRGGLCLNRDQIRRLPGITQHLEQHAGGFTQHLYPVPEISGVVLRRGVHLKAAADQERAEFGY